LNQMSVVFLSMPPPKKVFPKRVRVRA